MEDAVVKPPANSNPYVGPRSFLPGEHIYGRSRESAELLDLLIAERIVLLHSPSGAGKSSLVNASLVPEMREQGFWVLPIVRVNMDLPKDFEQKTAGLNRYSFSVLRSLESELPSEVQYPLDTLAGMTLAQYMAEYPGRGAVNQAEGFDTNSSLFIIFDQFEELVRVSAVDRNAKLEFFNQVGEMLRDRNIWALFVIREDYLATIEPYTRPIPNRLSVTYRLDFLDARSAIEAIQLPAREKGVDFEDAAATKLVDDLRRIRVQQADGTALEQLGLYVEPVQLQVVCLRLWDSMTDRNKITIDDVSKAGNIDDALGDYYAFQVGSVAVDEDISERQIREWFDRKLITVHGIRGQVLMEPDSSGGLSNKTIKMLQEAYLVRADKRGNAIWFELAHDRLTRPIRRNNAEWFVRNLNVFQRQADLWNNQGRPDSLLLGGAAYLEADQWAKAHADELLPAEREFLEGCKSEYHRTVREVRTNLLIRWAAVLMTVLAIAALFFFVQAQAETARATAQEVIARAEAQRANEQEAIAKDQEARAREQEALAYQKEQIANINSQIAHLRELAAQSVSNLSVDPELSVKLALQAIQGVDIQQPEMESAINQAEDALRQALPAMRVEQVLRDPDISAADSLSHVGAVWGASFSVNGQHLATAGNDGTLKIWDTLTGHLLKTISVLKPAADGYGVTSVAFSPDGKLLAASTGDGRILLYDAVTFAETQSIQAMDGVIWSTAFSPDGVRLVSGGQKGVVVIWDLLDNSVQSLKGGHTADVQSVTFSRNGTRIATAGADSLAIVWDSGTLRPLYRLQGHTGYVNGVAFSPDGKRLATAGGEDRTIILWDISIPSTPKLLTISGHRDWVYSLAFTADGLNLISVSADRTIRFWDTTYGRPGMVLVGHKDQIYGLALGPDGKRIATTSKDNTVRVWNISPEGSREMRTFDNHASVLDIAVSPDGKQLLTAGGDKLVHVWDIASGHMTSTMSGHNGIVEGVAYSPDGSKIATVSRDTTARIWDAASGKELLTFSKHAAPLRDVAFSPDGKRVATASEDGSVKIWDPETGAVSFDLPSSWSSAFSLAFSPDGSILAVGYYDETVILWNPSTGGRLAVLTGHSDIVRTLAFSPDGKVLASAGDDGSIILWDMDPNRWGSSQAPLRGRGDTIFGLAFSADGKFLFSGGADGVGTLWNLEERAVEFQTYGHTDHIYTLDVSANGKNLYSGGRDGTVRGYAFELTELVTLASQRTTREFSEDECRQYLNAACPTDVGAIEDVPSLVQRNQPDEVPSLPDSQLRDNNSSVLASELRANGGDEYDLNLFERPFNGGEMNIYYPDVDITHASIVQDQNWFYLTLTLAGPRGDGLYGNYGIELDLDVDGRGDYFVSTLAPGNEWSTNGVRIWYDKNGDVGNGLPYVSDPPQNGDGYEVLVFDQGSGDSSDLAWSRIDPNNPKNVQIAFQRSVIARDPVFAWIAWASRDAFKPAWFDYNDHFTFADAGSPLREMLKYYPLKALAGVDNTCHAPVGFNASNQSGFCQPDLSSGSKNPSTP
jgi:WD40 repeat protein